MHAYNVTVYYNQSCQGEYGELVNFHKRGDVGVQLIKCFRKQRTSTSKLIPSMDVNARKKNR